MAWSRDDARTGTALRALADSDPQSDTHRSARDDLIVAHLGLAESIAWRFDGRGEAHDDLVQVARIGLVNAADRFDPTKGPDFLAFAVPTMMGEIRRHFRDTAWALRVPRRLQELSLAVAKSTAELSQDLGRAPTPRELAVHLDVAVSDVLEALSADNAYHALSTDAPARESDTSPDRPLGETVGTDDPELEVVEDRMLLRSALADLPERERQILRLRFIDNMTQSRIAERVGISQMHVSRILSATLRELRDRLPESGA
ncbi:SigB/SigF/SigG family RNA polymerase sigma factor [Tsukamurella soli]|uniref:SigB/SigF/SigG family RNA polymerase sigma factor n=1 Tax=Tsukamurella soli TaxID=644556 RepID=A0ABP8J6F5_9ACTN